jgi:hypothetical protein
MVIGGKLVMVWEIYGRYMGDIWGGYIGDISGRMQYLFTPPRITITNALPMCNP